MGTNNDYRELKLEPDKGRESDLFTVGPHTALTTNYWGSGDVTLQLMESEPGEGVTMLGKIRVPKHARAWLASQLRRKDHEK